MKKTATQARLGKSMRLGAAVRSKPKRVSSLPPRPGAGTSFPIVGIGASAGGLEAFTQLLAHLPPDSGMAFVFIQHLSPTHTSFLSEALSRATQMPVLQVEDGMRVKPNHVYVISPSADVEIADGVLRLRTRPAESHLPHLPIDVFLRSLAATRGSHAIGVILSGTASDGTDGLRAIKAENGITLAQEPRSAKFGGMPQSAIQAGVVDSCLPLPQLAQELVRLSLHPYTTTRQAERPRHAQKGGALERLFSLVRNAVGVDFSEYKSATFERRLARRMALRRVDNLQDYVKLVEEHPEEARALYEDALIHVTSFFRDPEAFEALKEKVFPEILKHKPEGAPLRLWSAGCSTGEEVYSLAICLLEFLGSSPREHPIQIFGSDISEQAIEKARAGLYPESALRDVSKERRARYFSQVDGSYRIAKAVRELCVFVRHDLARDPPFSKLDLVACRNVLIYFTPALQKRVLATFHYCLNTPGFLLLGRTESVSGLGQLFSAVDKSHKLLARTAAPSKLRFTRGAEFLPTEKHPRDRASLEPVRSPPDTARRIDRLLLSRYAPPGVVINERMEILQFRGHTGPYLEPAPGEPQFNLLKMARDGLLSPLRVALAQARKQNAPIRTEGVQLSHDDTKRLCDIVVAPVTKLPEEKERLYVVLFEEVALPGKRGEKPGRRAAASREPAKETRRVPALMRELAATKEYLESLIEEHGRTNDALASANEELVSGNEELQSMNEELETAKEELQSTNEELTTVNDELHNRNQELHQANGDLINLLDTVDIPILILDLERRIRRFTPKTRGPMNILPSDVGRPIGDITLNLSVTDLDAQLAEVIERSTLRESEVQDRAGRWYRMQLRPYLTPEHKIDGATLSLVDIDMLKHQEIERAKLLAHAQQAKEEAERANRAKDQFLATLSHELRTPLSTMLLQAQLLRRGDLDAAKLKRAAEAIERGTKLQVQLIDDLLDVSRIVTGKLRVQFEPLHLPAVVRAALESVSAEADRKSLRIEISLDESLGPVSGDATRLQQIVWNLLTNAIKFSSKGQHVSVVLDRLDGHARLRVRDNGAGIEAEFLPRIFDRFMQEDSSSTRVFGGLGLGLAIVRHLVELHGGTVQAESPGKGQGATFTVLLPLLPVSREQAGAPSPLGPEHAQSAPPPRNARASPRLRGLRLLVVEDDPGTLEATTELLSLAGAEVRAADSPAAALALVEDFNPEVLLSDIAMPGEDGYTFLRKVRALGPERGGDVRAIALTALASAADRQQALSAGFQLHLAKPIDIDRLVEAVANVWAHEAPPEASPRAPP